MGFRRGDVLNIHLHNCQQYVVAFLACAQLGGVITTSNPAYVAAELANQHRDSGTRFVLSSKAYEGAVLAAVAESGVERGVFWVEDESCFANALPVDAPPPAPDVPIDAVSDVVTVPYSSGTTGLPKGVMLTHSNLTSNVLQTMRAMPNVGREDALIAVLPLYHIYGMTILMCFALAQQCEVVLLHKFEPPSFLDAMSRFKISVGFLVPPIILFLAKHPSVKQHDLSHLRWIMSGAAPLDASTQEALATELGAAVTQGWGMTELSPIGLCSDCDDVVWGSAGRLVAGSEAAVADEDGNSLPFGATGELLIRGPQVMKGYLGREEATRETIRPDGFLRTGDLAYYDAPSGHFFIAERLKELIKVKGFQVAPAEVEGRLLELPQIADAAVIGVPDERAGQRPKAFVVRKPDASGVSEAELLAALSHSLAEYKLPAKIVFVDAVPKSPSGKILRRFLPHD